MQRRGLTTAIILILIVFTVITISSCTPKTPENVPNLEYRVGKEGITAGFLADSPPKKVYAQSPLYIPIEIKNIGAYDNNPNSLGAVYLHGFDKTAMPFADVGDANYVRKDLPPVSGKSAFLKEGGADYSVTFEVKEGELKVPYGDKYEPTLMLSTCYSYRTLATPTVCIIPDPSLLIKNKICEPKTLTMTSQGAPIAVTKVEEEVSKGIVNFLITVENIGGGNVVDLASLGDCPFKLDNYNKINTVDVTVNMKSAQLMSCLPSKKIRLINGKGTVFCRFAIATSETASFTTPLTVQLDYGYNTNVKRVLTIAKVPGTPTEYLNNNAGITNPSGASGSGGSATSSTLYMTVNGQTCNPGSTIYIDAALGTQVTAIVNKVASNVAYCGIDEMDAQPCPASFTVSPGSHTMRGLDSNKNPVVYENCNIEKAALH
jgi:hypothetical protein